MTSKVSPSGAVPRPSSLTSTPVRRPSGRGAKGVVKGGLHCSSANLARPRARRNPPLDERLALAFPSGKEEARMGVSVLVGSKKGAFLLESDAERRDWRVRGPFCEHWPLMHVAADPATGAIHAAGGNAWFGPAIWTSRDFGASWSHSSAGLAYPQGETPVQCAWSVHAAHGRLYVG